MAEIGIRYAGDLATCAVMGETGAEIWTDAPKEAHGLGRYFSPTDLLALSLASCALTMMGLAARRLKVDISGTRAVATKEMVAAPKRRIGKIGIEFFCPHLFPEDVVKALVDAVESCPIHHSLHPDVQQEFVYHWGVL